MLEMALSQMSIKPEEAIAVGDRPETDILGGKNSGCKTALVLSGVTSQADVAALTIKPDIIATNLLDLVS